jgi:hypothetical protein
VQSFEIVDAARLPTGTEVEVLSRYEGRWTTGFAVEAVHPDGYRLRRHSDGYVLPVAIPTPHVRPRP